MPACPVCSSTDNVPLHERQQVPVMMNRVYRTPEAARQAMRGTVHMHGCMVCGFAWNAAFDPKLVIYDESYENDQCHSPAFSAHVLERARDIVANGTDGKINFLDIGCGQGTFITLVAEAAGDRLGSAEGFDPAWRGMDGEGPAGSHIHKCYFTAASAHLCIDVPNVVASRHTIEHVADPVAFLDAIRQAMKAFEGEGGTIARSLFVETPSIEWIIQNRAVQDFFYEHCSLFSARALALAMTRAGFHAPLVHQVFGGQYLWARAVTERALSQPIADAPSSRQDFSPLIEARSRVVSDWRNQLAAAATRGRVSLWGAGAKGVTFTLLADPTHRLIDHVIDINPGKQGSYLSGSGVPVVAPEAAARRPPETIFVMNPIYLDEIARTCHALGMTARLLPIN